MAKVAKRRGRYVLDFYDHAGIRRRETMPEGTTKKRALEELRTREEQIARGTYLPEKKVPLFSEVAQDWIEHKKEKLRANTWEVYEGHVRNHFKDFNDLKINQITTAKVEKYITLKQAGKVPIGTIRKILVTLGQIFGYAVRHRYIDYNPLRDAERPRDPGEGKKEIKVLSPKEIKALLDNTADQKYRALFMLGIMSGARQGELLGLKWSDLDFAGNQLHVQRTYTKGRFFNTKTRTSNRKIDLGPAVIAELRKWKLACPPSELDLMFPNEAQYPDGKPNGKPINYTNMVNRHFQPALKSVAAKGLDKCRKVKDLRNGAVAITCKDHGFQPGEKIVIHGTRNYDGCHFVLPGSAPDLIKIRADYVAERMKASSMAIREMDTTLFAELSRFRFHDLRHTYASLLIEQGENIKYIQTQLGHSSPMVTLTVYAHLFETSNQQAACRLECAVFGDRSQNGHKKQKGS
ncbi:MAG: tyrosine-type recombinase/integrase [Syntrophobacteraceae bacterium]